MDLKYLIVEVFKLKDIQESLKIEIELLSKNCLFKEVRRQKITTMYYLLDSYNNIHSFAFFINNKSCRLYLVRLLWDYLTWIFIHF
jgi:hypothetical protein